MYFYYDSDSNVYHTVADAIKSNKTFWFYFHDEILTKVDWKIEPLLSLDELYKIRAQQIRDEYPYVVLCYSGGTDSTAMLETFYYNNIHIDEILVVGALSQDPHQASDKNHNGDLYHNAFPLLNKLSWPNTKITIADYSKWFCDDMIKDFTIIRKFGDDWAKHIGSFQSVHLLFWYELKRLIGANNEKETAVVFGSDKTKIEYESSGRMFTRFNNLSFCDYGQHYHNENYHRVNFYSSGEPTSIEIMKKQAHITYRVSRECIAVNAKLPELHKLYYRYKTPLNFMSEKTKQTIFSPRDAFILDKKDSELYSVYERGIYNLKQQMPLTAKYSVFSRPYYIT